VSRYRWVDSQRAEHFPVAATCRVAGVSRQAYYEWKEREAAGATDAQWDEAHLVNEMYDIHADFDETYGSPRMTGELRRRGYCVNHKRAERLMRLHGIVGVTPRRSVRTTIRDDLAPPLPDLIGRDFSPGEPNRRYCGDITYVPTGEGWLYLATALDLGSRRLAGWAVADHMRTELVAEALEHALDLRGSLAGAIFHSDRGSQGEINRSSQHLTIVEVLDGSSSASSRSRSATGDAITGASTTPARDRATVLDGDRQGTHADRGSRHRRSFAASRATLVSQRRRHSAIRFGSAVRPLPLIS
jgi:hypothetical protein